MFHPAASPSKTEQLNSELKALNMQISEQKDYLYKLNVSLAILKNENIPAEILSTHSASELNVNLSNIDDIHADALKRLKKKDGILSHFFKAQILGHNLPPVTQTEYEFHNKKSLTIQIFEELIRIAENECKQLESKSEQLEEAVNNEELSSLFSILNSNSFKP